MIDYIFYVDNFMNQTEYCIINVGNFLIYINWSYLFTDVDSLLSFSIYIRKLDWLDPFLSIFRYLWWRTGLQELVSNKKSTHLVAAHRRHHKMLLSDLVPIRMWVSAVRTTDLNLNFNKFQIEYKCGSDAANNMNSEPSPGSPDRQFCSSTTSAIGDFGNESNMQEVKEEIPR